MDHDLQSPGIDFHIIGLSQAFPAGDRHADA
jgi:hypothetical protein